MNGSSNHLAFVFIGFIQYLTTGHKVIDILKVDIEVPSSGRSNRSSKPTRTRTSCCRLANFCLRSPSGKNETISKNPWAGGDGDEAGLRPFWRGVEASNTFSLLCILRDLTNDTLVKHPHTACVTPPNVAEVRLSGVCWRRKQTSDWFAAVVIYQHKGSSRAHF